MSSVKELIGLELPSYTYTVERGKIREFALAIGDPNPIYYDEEAARYEAIKAFQSR